MSYLWLKLSTKDIAKIKINNPNISNIDAIERYIGTPKYEEISTGRFHDIWFKDLESNKFIDKKTGTKNS